MFGPFKRRPKPEKDWFTCPVCGEPVVVGALACRECGSDEKTGWSDATEYDDLDLPEPEGIEIPDTLEEFEALARRRKPLSKEAWAAIVVTMAVLFLIATLLSR